MRLPRLMLALAILPLWTGTAESSPVITQNATGSLRPVGRGDAYFTQDNGVVDVGPAFRTPLLPATHLNAIELKFLRTTGSCPDQRFNLTAWYFSSQTGLTHAASTNFLPADGSDALFEFGSQPDTLDHLYQIVLGVDPNDPTNFAPCNDWDTAVSWIGSYNYASTRLVTVDDHTFSPFVLLSDDSATGEDVPIILVHGYCSDPTAFGSMGELLEGDTGRVIDNFDYSPLTATPEAGGNTISIEQLATIFAGHVDAVLRQHAASQVDVVAHSMGGLVVRAWMAGLTNAPYKGQIRRLVMIGTPQYGASIAELDRLARAGHELGLRCSRTQAAEMRFGSFFLSRSPSE